jgi:hypothetical protein
MTRLPGPTRQVVDGGQAGDEGVTGKLLNAPPKGGVNGGASVSEGALSLYNLT